MELVYLLLILIGIAGVALSIYLLVQHLCTKKVKETSSQYKGLLKLNEEYADFDYSVRAFFQSEKRCENKQKYDRFNANAYITEFIESDHAYFARTIKRIDANKEKYKEYRKALRELCPSSDRSRLYQSCERKLFEQTKLNPPIDLCVKVEVSYESPKGRNYYHKSYTANRSQVVALMKKHHEKMEFKKSKKYQRSIMSDALRYQILKRDNFACVLCGRTAQMGATLEVDHIFPISKGGKTVPENLRTLCSSCNQGKGASYDYNGMN